MQDWTVQAANTIVDTVGAVRERTLVPARRAVRLAIFALVASVTGLTLASLAVIGGVRALSVALDGNVWAAYAILGGIFLLAGWLCWARSRP